MSRTEETDEMPRTQVWSFGGGVQSAGIAVLVREGVLPKPDLAVIANTGRERQETWDYLKNVIQPYLDHIGLTIQVADHATAGVDLYANNGDLLIPAFTVAGRLPTFCSGSWKRDVVERWMRKQGVKEADVWIGFSTDEIRRCGKAHREWAQPRYPLIEKRLSRRSCLALVEKSGLPEPPRSRCFMCPHQNAEEWRQVRSNPEEWAAAVALDEKIRNADERGGLFLHHSRVPLALADLGTEGDDMPLFRKCQDAGCWT